MLRLYSVSMTDRVTIVGAGLAGCEAAWQLSRAGIPVDLLEARPAVQSPAHQTLLPGELVCSNSLRSDAPESAPGQLKAELRRSDSLILRAADATRVPAGGALAVDRTAFAWRVTAELLRLPNLRLRRHAVDDLPSGPVVLASGPLTSAGLSKALGHLLGAGLYFYDAIAPIIDAESIDWERAYHGARRDPGCQDYVNCPLDAEQYRRLVQGLLTGEQTPPHPFEEPRFFEGCLPVEVMASRGPDVLAYGPLRPVGLEDPRTGRRPHAVVQLRAEDPARTSYNLVGFQTRLTQPEQRRVFRMIPGLQRCRFFRFGSIHRNAYIDAPRLLGPRLELRGAAHVRAAGQLAGVEGYLESTAMGMLAGVLLAADLRGVALDPPPETTATGALYHHLLRARMPGERFEPQKINFGLLPPAPKGPRRKRERRRAVVQRAMSDFGGWADGLGGLSRRS